MCTLLPSRNDHLLGLDRGGELDVLSGDLQLPCASSGSNAGFLKQHILCKNVQSVKKKEQSPGECKENTDNLLTGQQVEVSNKSKNSIKRQKDNKLHVITIYVFPYGHFAYEGLLVSLHIMQCFISSYDDAELIAS